MFGRRIQMLGCFAAIFVLFASCASLKSGMTTSMKALGMEVAEVKHHQVVLTDLDSRFKPWIGGPLDIFAGEPVEYNSVGLPELDQFAKDIAHVKAVTLLARHVANMAREGNPAALAGAGMMAVMAKDLLGTCQSLVSQGQNLVGALPSRLANPKYAPIADDVLLAAKDCIACASSALADIPGIVTDLAGGGPAK
jgi:hypothetical protein